MQSNQSSQSGQPSENTENNNQYEYFCVPTSPKTAELRVRYRIEPHIAKSDVDEKTRSLLDTDIK